MNSRLMAAAALVGAVASVAGADAVQWRTQVGGNGHWYAVAPQFTSFPVAEAAAIARGGHLATLVTQEENAFITAQGLPYSQNGVLYGYWLGGVRSVGTNQWTWITGEDWGFTNFDVQEPNGCCGPDVRYLLLRTYPGHEGRWDDTSTNGTNDSTPWPSLIEWSADCNNDGIVDYGQCRDGSLADFNTNNIPDCCEQGQACVTGSYPVQWRTTDGGNGHWYHGAPNEGNSLWDAARDFAASRGGHLATIASNAEFRWIVTGPGSSSTLWNGTRGPFLGGQQAAGESTSTSGWSWITGESWHAEWGLDNCGADNFDNANVLALGRCSTQQNVSYNDWPSNSNPFTVYGLVIEWSADCNNDGAVDYGQILNGTLADANGNLIPDACEAGDCSGDVNADSTVNGDDLAIVLSNWGENPPKGAGDANHDGLVDGSDLALVLGSWGPCGG